MVKLTNNLRPDIMKYDFKLNDRSYNTRKNWDFQRKNKKTVLHKFENLFSVGPQVWDVILPGI